MLSGCKTQAFLLRGLPTDPCFRLFFSCLLRTAALEEAFGFANGAHTEL